MFGWKLETIFADKYAVCQGSNVDGKEIAVSNRKMFFIHTLQYTTQLTNFEQLTRGLPSVLLAAVKLFVLFQYFELIIQTS